MLTRIGVTGGIASGKSEVCHEFKSLGAEVLSADLIARHLIETDPAIRAKIISIFGPQAYDSRTGLLDRARVGAGAFGDKTKLRSLNAAVHPAVLGRIETEIGVLELHTTARYVAIEAALVYESGMDKTLDYILAVAASENARMRRTRDRDGLSDEKIRARMAGQRPQKETIADADFVLYNDDSLDALRSKARFFHSLFATLKPRRVINDDKK